MTIEALTTIGPDRKPDNLQDAGPVPIDSSRPRQGASAVLAAQQWSVDWCFHGEPPAGLPRRMALELIAVPDRSGARPGHLCRLYERTLQSRPAGYGLCWMKHTRPPRRRTAEQRAAQRLGNLKRRLAAQAPLFADEFLERELKARPDYFAGEKDTAFRDRGDAETAALFERLLAGDMGMTIFHRWWLADGGRGVA